MSNEINILIEEIENIAAQTQGYIRDDAHDSATSFANVTLAAGAFAGIPQGVEFHAQQEAAHTVFVETINGVVADLETFGATLAANAASHRAVDESNADTMTAMEARRADEQAAVAAMTQVNDQYPAPDEAQGDSDAFAAEQAYDETREGNEALDVETEHDAGASGAADSGADSGSTAPPPADAGDGASDAYSAG